MENVLLIVVLIGAVYVLPRIKFSGDVRPRRGSRADGELYYQQVRKEIGIDPYSPAELAQMEKEERENADWNSRAIAAWSPIYGTMYKDSYGVWHKLDEE